MKKVLFCLIFIFLLACGNTTKEVDYNLIVQEALSKISIEAETKTNLTFTENLTIQDNLVSFTYETNNEAISNNGVVSRLVDDVTVEITVKATCNGVTKEKVFVCVVLGTSDESLVIINDAFELLEVYDTTFADLSLHIAVEVGGHIVSFSYVSDKPEVLSNTGVCRPLDYEDAIVTYTVTGSIYGTSTTRDFVVVVTSIQSYVDEIASQVVLPEAIDDDLALIESIGAVCVSWNSNNTSVLTSKGVLKYVSSPVDVILKAYYYYDVSYSQYTKVIEYQIKAMPFNALKRYKLIEPTVSIPSEVTQNLFLATSFDYDVTGYWMSSNEQVLSTSGKINPLTEDVVVNLILSLQVDGKDTYQISFEVVVKARNEDDFEKDFFEHNLIDRAVEFSSNGFNNVVLVNNKLELANDAISGYYESKVFNTLDFTSVVGSFSAITSTTATATLEISVRVGNNWSKYFSYGEWGLGRTNIYYDSSDSYAKLSTDEIIVSNSKRANGVKYKITLKRTNLSNQSPKLSIVAMALLIPNYTYNVDTSNLPNAFDIEAPKLYQHDVPTIGSVICSATTTTMLLKYKGFSFTDKGFNYEHEYIAKMVADTGHNNPTYGNWSYNMITAGAFGVDAYVARIYSFDEIKYHLVNVGPIGASVKGQFGSYYTNGHLVLVRGYRTVNNNTTVILNDPNIKGVYYEVSLQTFLTCYRGVSYVVL